MSKEKTKVYLYTRVSTAMQIDGYSLDAQKSRMKAFCEFNDYEIVGEYEDKIEDTENLLVDAKSRKRSILAEKVCGDNIYKALVFFDKMYENMNESERREFFTDCPDARIFAMWEYINWADFEVECLRRMQIIYH